MPEDEPMDEDTQDNCLANKDICKMRCCKRIHIQIHNPELFDIVDFYNMHKGIRVITKKNKKILEIKTKCNNLQDDGTCGIWETRPAICREAYTVGDRQDIIYFKGCIYKIPGGIEFDDDWIEEDD